MIHGIQKAQGGGDNAELNPIFPDDLERFTCPSQCPDTKKGEGRHEKAYFNQSTVLLP